MRPYDVKTTDDILAMESDNFGGLDQWSILSTEDEIYLHPPASKRGDTFCVTIPRDQFNAIVDWYMKEQP